MGKRRDRSLGSRSSAEDAPVRLTVDATEGLVLVVADPGGHLLLHPEEARRMAKLLRAAGKKARKRRRRKRQ